MPRLLGSQATIDHEREGYKGESKRLLMRLIFLYALLLQIFCVLTCRTATVISSAKADNQKIDATIAEIKQAQADGRIDAKTAKAAVETLESQKKANIDRENALVAETKKAEKNEHAAGQVSGMKWAAIIGAGLLALGGLAFLYIRRFIPLPK